MRRLNPLVVFGLWLGLPILAAAVDTSFWQVGSFDEMVRGKLNSVSLGKDGELKLAPQSETVFHPEEALALSLAADGKGCVYVGTGHQGKVFRVDASLKYSLLFTAQEPDVFALAVGPDGALYVGTSPDGKVYRVTPDGKSRVFYDPKSKYIWALAFDKQGRLYAGTGDKGQILRVDAAGKGEVFYDSTQTHIMCLTFDQEGNLLAGSVPQGLIYRITQAGKPFVIYQSGFPEIHELTTDSQGRIYAAALGGTSGKATPDLFLGPAPAGQAPGPTTTVTVVAGSEGIGPATAPDAQTQQKPQAGPATAAPSFNRTGPAATAFPMLPAFQGRGALIIIHPDSTAELAWSSNNESVFGLALRGNQVLFSTDSDGRIFELDPSRDGQRLTLVTETQTALATRLLLRGGDLYATTTSATKLIRIAASLAAEGSYESSVRDAKFISRWGTLTWRADVPPGTSLEFYVRSGNCEKPDGTWSDWTGPYRNRDGSSISSAPPARYVQWKATLRGSGSATPVLNEVTLTYLTQNLAPQVRSFGVSTAPERTSPASGGAVSVTPTPGFTVTAPAGYGNVSPSTGARPKTPITLSWQADDPNGDQLVYAIYVKAADEHEWHLVKDKLSQTTLALDQNSLADGKYLARVVASDEGSNPSVAALRAEMVSAPFWVDNTPPTVSVLKSAIKGSAVEVKFQADDNLSPLRAAEVAIDAADWRVQLSDDGIVDSPTESFTVKASPLGPGEHVVTLRVFDTAGNAGLARVVVRMPSSK